LIRQHVDDGRTAARVRWESQRGYAVDRSVN
jgi:hypothetical protein